MTEEAQEPEGSEINAGEDAQLGKKEKESLFYWSLFFIAAVVILFFAAGKFYGAKEPEYEKLTYNNWEFTKIEGMWWFEWQKGGNLYQVPLRFSPYEAKEVPITGKVNTTAFNSRNYVYITFDLSNESSQNLSMLALAATELSQNIATAINRTPIAACTSEGNEACIDRPVKSCNSTLEPVIYLVEGRGSGIVLSDTCITVKGDGIGIVKSVDRLLYHWYGIYPQ